MAWLGGLLCVMCIIHICDGGLVYNMDQKSQKTDSSHNYIDSKDIELWRLAKLVGDQMCNHTDNFFFWGYGGAIIMDALHQANRTFQLDYSHTLNIFLDRFILNESYPGYKIAHNIPMMFDTAIGDGIGLFPINYVNRLRYELGTYDQIKTDEMIVSNVSDHYILGWPYHLPDGTVSRNHGWDQGSWGSWVWVDDAFMGITLPARMTSWRPNITLASWVLDQALHFASHLQDPTDGAYFHGYNNHDLKHSCCKWGRGNGWAIMSSLEVLEGLLNIDVLRDSQQYKQLMSMMVHQAEAMARYQSSDGRWHQLVDKPETYLETSGTAMIVASIARGIRNKFLDPDRFKPIVDQGLQSLFTVIKADGSVDGICVGTGVMTSEQAYQERPTSYLDGAPGLGAVLYAIVEVYRMQNSL